MKYTREQLRQMARVVLNTHAIDPRPVNCRVPRTHHEVGGRRMNRRGFLGAILAAGVAPSIVRADALMRIVPRDLTLIPPPGTLYWPFVDNGDMTFEWSRGPDGLIADFRITRGAGRYVKPSSDGWVVITAGRP